MGHAFISGFPKDFYHMSIGQALGVERMNRSAPQLSSNIFGSIAVKVQPSSSKWVQ
jgi:hypothetical protein